MSWPALLTAADRAVLATMGETVQYTEMNGVTIDVVGLFDQAYVRVEAGESGVSSSGPAIFFRLEDLPTDPEADEDARVTRGGKTYTVREVEKDGQGGVLLLLSEV